MEPNERGLDARQRLGPHLDQGELEVSLPAGLGMFQVVTPFDRAVGTPVAEAIVHRILNFAPPVDQDLPLNTPTIQGRTSVQ